MKYYSINYFETLKQIATQYLSNNYQYVYLESMHNKNQTEGTETIITGSSYAMNGIVEKLLGNVINFSVSSQDLYYDFLHIKDAVEKGKQKISNCIVNIGYYGLYQDLSLSRHINRMIPAIYKPLFHDVHHYDNKIDYDMWGNLTYDRQMYSDELVRKLCREWARKVLQEQSSYYGDLVARGSRTLASRGRKWEALDCNEKDEIAKKRASDHNRLIKHADTCRENGKLLCDMVQYLHDNKIRTVFLIFPFTDYYKRYLYPGYKEDLYQALNELELPVELLDMNDCGDFFCDADFTDSDHLSQQGAEKATRLLSDYMITYGSDNYL